MMTRRHRVQCALYCIQDRVLLLAIIIAVISSDGEYGTYSFLFWSGKFGHVEIDAVPHMNAAVNSKVC